MLGASVGAEGTSARTTVEHRGATGDGDDVSSSSSVGDSSGHGTIHSNPTPQQQSLLSSLAMSDPQVTLGKETLLPAQPAAATATDTTASQHHHAHASPLENHHHNSNGPMGGAALWSDQDIPNTAQEFRIETQQQQQQQQQQQNQQPQPPHDHHHQQQPQQTIQSQATVSTTPNDPIEENTNISTHSTVGSSLTISQNESNTVKTGSVAMMATSSSSSATFSSSTSSTSCAKSRPAPTEDDDDDDVTSKAAIALAAVAAAAVANHKSPAEAAAQARAVAQTFLGNNGNGSGGKDDPSPLHLHPHDLLHGQGPAPQWRRVHFKSVQRHLRARIAATKTATAREQPSGLSSLVEHLAQGDNDCFLQQLLLLEYFQIMDDEEGGGIGRRNDETCNPDRGGDPVSEASRGTELAKSEEEMATLASERILSVLKKMEGAYESLVNLLPPFRKNSTDVADPEASIANTQSSIHGNTDDYETDSSVVVPDLLPPCWTPKGDATLGFFRECSVREVESPMSKTMKDGIDMGQAASSGFPDLTTNDEAEQGKEGTSILTGTAVASPGRAAVSSMFGMFRRTTLAVMSDASKKQPTTTSTLMSTFRRKGKNDGVDEDDCTMPSESAPSSHKNQDSYTGLRPGEYVVKIEREMLGLTVENVLERTVVRTVLAGGPAKKAGAKVGSLIVKVGNVETKNLTHFETIDELRQSQRPLILVLKQLSEESLRAAREEMGRLIRGAGFGAVMDGQYPFSSLSLTNNSRSSTNDQNFNNNAPTDGTTAAMSDVGRPLIAADLRLEAYTNYIRRRLLFPTPHNTNNAANNSNNKKDEGVGRASEKLIWILTLFVFGLEREIHLLSEQHPSTARNWPHHPHGSHLYQHTLKEYTDSAKSAAKVLLDFTRKKTNPPTTTNKGLHNNANNATDGVAEQPRRRKGGGLPPPPPPLPGSRGGFLRRVGKGRSNLDDSNIAHEKPLLQIGDVLQRTRTFLADTTSPPAALLRGEVIALLCDILDVDTEMEMSEEDSISATSGAQAGPINDLGSAGSLLKLIVLNCPIMRSPVCEENSGFAAQMDAEVLEELRRRIGKKQFYSSSELHRLHAGNRFLAVVHRLAASRSMSARITACSLGPVIWGHLDFPHQLQLRGVITRALHDVEVMVRKATANVLHEIAELVFDARCVPWLVLMCERSMTDPEPQMRSAAMTLTWHLAEHLPNTFVGDASQGSRYLRRLPARNDPIFADVYLLQCKLLPVATRLAEDRSPSVRLAVAAQCDRLCDALGDHWSSVVIDVLLGLLSDSDERVRCEAVMCVPRLAGIVLLSSPPGTSVSEVSILEALVPASIRLQNDAVAVVRVALASAAGELLTLLVALQGSAEDGMVPQTLDASTTEVYRRYKEQVDERLVPLVQTLLNDPDPEVTSAGLRAVTNASRRSIAIPSSQRPRLPSISTSVTASTDDDSASVTSLQSHTSRGENRQPVFLPVLSEVQVLRLLPTLSELADSKQWRVRQSAVEIVPALLGCTQKLETRTEISHLCVRLMSDKVDEVRKTAAECLCMGGSSLGSHGEDASAEWFHRIVIPAIRRCATHANSKQRLLSLKMVEIVLLNGACPTKWTPQSQPQPTVESSTGSSSCSGDLPSSSPTSELVATALSLCNDRIANVRLNVGRSLESVLSVLGPEDLNRIVEGVGNQLQQELNNNSNNKKEEGGNLYPQPPDRDVIFFASRCTNRAKATLFGLMSE